MNGSSEKEEASIAPLPTAPSAADPLADPAAELPMVPVTDVIAVQVDTVETVEVVAPSNLPGGYHLTVVDVDGRSILVEVPLGGAASGEPFQAIVVRRQHPRDHVPIGNWRDGIFDCCKLGLFHPVVCLGYWTAPVALGQVMTRLHLNACAEYQRERSTSCCSAFRTMLALYIVTSLTTGFIGQILESFLIEDDDDDEQEPGDEPGWFVAISFTRVGWAFFYYVFVVIVAIRTRAYVRKRYKIKPQYGCGECEDVCCVFVCYPCVVCQLSRHTANYENQQARCCTDTGLKSESPMPV